MKKREKTEKNRRLARLCCLAAGVIILLLAICIGPFMVGAAGKTAVVKIPVRPTAELTMQALGDTLTAKFGDKYARKVMKFVRLDASRMQGRNGAYEIAAGTSPLRAAIKLTRGAQMPVKITINGFRLPETMTKMIAGKLSFSAEELDAAMHDEELLKEYGLTPDNAMALFLDATYETYWNVTPEKFVRKVGEYYKRVWNKERTAKAGALGLTPAEVEIIASIADEETLKKDEKGAVGRLYINRLHKGMRLQADPTVKYALKNFELRRINSTHTATSSPYNTYRNEGLPPGPIRTTSVETIDAILDSEPSDMLYMCARPDFSGYHDFAATFEEHRENAARYQKALNERNIH